MRLYTSSCVELVNHIDAESVDLILTDPPYPKEFLHCWKELATFADHALRPGGFLVAMSGQMYLPQVIASIENSDLSYQWTFPYRVGRDNNMIWPRCVASKHKMLLWYVKPPLPKVTELGLVFDAFRSSTELRDTTYHRWGQDVGGFMNMLNYFGRIGKTVCDPFLGGGTTALVAKAMGYDFIGADIDPECIETTKHRLETDGVQLSGLM